MTTRAVKPWPRLRSAKARRSTEAQASRSRRKSTWVKSAGPRTGRASWPDTLGGAARACTATPHWQRVHDPTSELVLTMLSAEQRRHQRREGVRRCCAGAGRRRPDGGSRERERGRSIAAGLGWRRHRGDRRRTGRPSSRAARTSSSTSSARAASRRPEGAAHPGCRCAGSASSAATTRSSSWASCAAPKRWPG